MCSEPGQSPTLKREGSPKSTHGPSNDANSIGIGPRKEGWSTGVAQAVASDEILTKNFISYVAEKVDVLVQKREARRQKIWNVVYVVAGLIGISGITAFISTAVGLQVKDAVEEQENYLREFSINAARTAVGEEISGLRNELADQVRYQRFAYLALSLEFEESGFSNAERDSVMALLDDLAPRDDLRRQEDFPVLLENVVDSFASADLGLQLGKIAETFRPEVLGSRGISYTLVQHFGQSLVGSSLPPSAWDEQEVALFEDFEKAAKSHGIPEVALPYRVLIEFLKSGNQASDSTRRHLGEAQSYSNAEAQAAFQFFLFVLTKAEYWQKEPSPQGTNIAEVASDFWSAHSAELEILRHDDAVQQQLSLRARRAQLLGREKLAHGIIDSLLS